MIYVCTVSPGAIHESAIQAELNKLQEALPEPCRLVNVYSPNSRPGVTLAVFEALPRRKVVRRSVMSDMIDHEYEER